VGQLLGADPDQLCELGGRMDSSADQVEHIAAGITALLSFSRWEGSDGERFRSEWNGSLRSRLTAVAGALRECGTTLRQNAAEQTDASRAEDGLREKLNLALGVTTVLADMAGLAGLVPRDMAAKLPKVVRGLAFNDLEKYLPDAKAAVKVFDGVGVGLNVVGGLLDVNEAMHAEPGADAKHKWIDVAFDGAATAASAAAFFPPAAPFVPAALVLIDGAHLLYDHPELPGQVVGAVGQGIASGVSAAEHAADAAEKVISGGVHAALSWL
jgi:uncharacterized protein YukE